ARKTRPSARCTETVDIDPPRRASALPRRLHFHSGLRHFDTNDPLRKSRRSCRQSANTPSTQVVADASLDRVQMTPGQSGARLFAEDLFHRLALGEFVDEFVEVADLAHHRLLNLLHAD